MVRLFYELNYNFAANPKSPILIYIYSFSIKFPSLRLLIIKYILSMNNFVCMNILHALDDLMQKILDLKLCKLFSFFNHFVQRMITT